MSDSLPTITEQAARELLTTITDTKQFVVAQAPDVLQQILFKQYLTAATVAVSAVVLAVLAVWLCRRAARPDNADSMEHGVPAIMTAVSAVILAIVAVCETFRAVTAYFAPKVYLLEYLTNLIKSA
jgi:heme/copper-type cytochrome/quinol oxidase subunit 2